MATNSIRSIDFEFIYKKLKKLFHHSEYLKIIDRNLKFELGKYYPDRELSDIIETLIDLGLLTKIKHQRTDKVFYQLSKLR